MDQVALLLQRIAKARLSLVAIVQPLTEKQAVYKPAPDVWSVNELLEHLVLAEVSGVAKIWAAADGVRSGSPVWVGEHSNEGLPIEEVIERTWRPKEIAPPIATPHIGGPLRYWISYLETDQTLVEKLAPVLDGLPLHRVLFPHFLSGPLDAAQRLEFLAFHMGRHQAQIQALMNHPGFPPG